MRYVVDNATALSREPINGYVIQVRNSVTGLTMEMFITYMIYK